MTSSDNMEGYITKSLLDYAKAINTAVEIEFINDFDLVAYGENLVGYTEHKLGQVIKDTSSGDLYLCHKSEFKYATNYNGQIGNSQEVVTLTDGDFVGEVYTHVVDTNFYARIFFDCSAVTSPGTKTIISDFTNGLTGSATQYNTNGVNALYVYEAVVFNFNTGILKIKGFGDINRQPGVDFVDYVSNTTSSYTARIWKETEYYAISTQAYGDYRRNKNTFIKIG